MVLLLPRGESGVEAALSPPEALRDFGDLNSPPCSASLGVHAGEAVSTFHQLTERLVGGGGQPKGVAGGRAEDAESMACWNEDCRR